MVLHTHHTHPSLTPRHHWTSHTIGYTKGVVVVAVVAYTLFTSPTHPRPKDQFPMTITIRDKDFRVVARSHNLRGILDYSRDHPVERVDLFPATNGNPAGTLGVTWTNGATTVADFASYSVMKKWVKARRCFRGAQIKEVN